MSNSVDQLPEEKARQERNQETLLRVEGLKKHFELKRSFLSLGRVPILKAVDGVSFDIKKGETLGLVGESGCGKSTLGRVILRLYEATAGQVYYEETDITALKKEELRRFRTKMQIVFQDSYSSLNPRQRVADIIAEPMTIHTEMSDSKIRARVVELLELVGLKAMHAERFPHEFSGGQRQRINIARALALYPNFIVCDEPISALDVSIQAQVVNLLQDLQKKLGITYLFIAHDLSMVQHISDRIAVMYLGKMMELAPSTALFREPLHPYTQSLISAIPLPNPKKERERTHVVLEGEVPSPVNQPEGCVFHTRCPLADERCGRETPEMREFRSGHHVACHYAGEKSILDEQQLQLLAQRTQ
ncbi:MAG TPA: dipeptide ABC transporter ATP-binding protein [Sediminispirochaeta sp.]|nr:dipeptide ABC transporter ATP-binding protein [Sediminispirochaeta sp.]